MGQWIIVPLWAQPSPQGESGKAYGTSIKDTSDIRSLNQQALDIHKTHTDSAIELVLYAIPITEKLGYKQGLYDLYQTLGMAYFQISQNQHAIEAHEAALGYAQELEDPLKQILSLRRMGENYNERNEKQLAIKMLRRALALAEAINDLGQQAKILNSMAIFYSYMTLFDSADISNNRSLMVYGKLGDQKSQSGVLMNLGNNAARSGDLEKAMRYYEQALGMKRAISDKGGEALIFQMMGYTYLVMGQIPQSLDQYQNALGILEAEGMDEGVANVLGSMAEVSLAGEDLPQALLYLEQAYEYWVAKGGDLEGIRMKKAKIYLLQEDYEKALELVLTNLQDWKDAKIDVLPYEEHLYAGICYARLNQPETALPMLQEAVKLSTSANNLVAMTECLVNLGRVYQKLGRLDQAKSSLEQGEEISKKIGNLEFRMEASGLLYQLHKEQGNAVIALGYLESFTHLQDSLKGEKNIKQIARLEADFAFEKEKQQIQLAQEQELEKQQSLQRIFLFALIAAVVLILTIGWFYRSKQKVNQQLNQLNQELREQKTLIERQKGKLEELDEAKSRFFTNISHEFRTPLTIISGMIDQITTKPDQWLEKGAQMIKQNTLQLLSLVNQILDLRKLESSNLELDMVQGDIVSYLRYILDSFQGYANGKGIQLHFLSDQAQIQMDYDPEKFMRILSNLLSNALKYTPEGGHVYLNLGQRDDLLHLRIQDTGAGIPPDQLPYIFDRFYQVDDSSTRKGEGTGIGLALTKALVQLMQGEIMVSSELGQGTSFLITLPITQQSAVQELPEESAVKEQLQTMSAETNESLLPEPVIATSVSQEELPTLLIVEDNPGVRQFLVACLEDSYQLQLASNGQEGIDKAIGLIPDVIVSDVMMPEKNGYELCETLKQDERTSHIPIILLTAKADLDSKVSGLELGADAYLTKPVESKELLARLKNLLKLRQQLQARYSSFEFRHVKQDQAPSKEDAFLLKITQLVEENLSDEAFGNAQLAKEMNMSESQLYRKIKALTNKTPVPFIRSIRLHKAKELLMTTELNVSEVGYEVGFTDPAYFSRAFSKEFKLPPREVRK